MKVGRCFFWYVSLGVLLSFATGASAGTYRFNRARTTTAQEFIFCQRVLGEILAPEGYELDLNSLDISEEVPMPPLQTPVIVETPEFAVHTVLFQVTHEGKRFQGMTYLILISVQKLSASNLKSQITVNSTAQTLSNYGWADASQTTLSLAISPEYRLFKAEIRPHDLNLLPVSPSIPLK